MIPNKSTGSIKNGNWFIFHDEKNAIQIWGSNLNGKEKVFLNEVLVSEQRSLKKKSGHTFKDKNDVHYEVNFETPSLLKGTLQCEIKREGVLLKTFKATYIKGVFFTWQRISIAMLSIIIFTILHDMYHVSDFMFFVFLAAILIIHIFTRDPGKIIIELT